KHHEGNGPQQSADDERAHPSYVSPVVRPGDLAWSGPSKEWPYVHEGNQRNAQPQNLRAEPDSDTSEKAREREATHRRRRERQRLNAERSRQPWGVAQRPRCGNPEKGRADRHCCRAKRPELGICIFRIKRDKKPKERERRGRQREDSNQRKRSYLR